MSRRDITTLEIMGRWQPDGRGRLALAAMQLYAERGYEQTTVADIAERAGLTARTFFRHFTDKREVLFAGSDLLAVRLAEELAGQPAGMAPLTAVSAALDTVAEMIGDDHGWSRTRRDVIAATAELQERERTKMAAWSTVLAEGLTARGVDSATARLVAESGVAVFRVAFEQWVDGPADRSLTTYLQEGFARLRAVAAQA